MIVRARVCDLGRWTGRRERDVREEVGMNVRSNGDVRLQDIVQEGGGAMSE